jgi:hypothetical protein
MYGVPNWGASALKNVYAESMWSLGFWGWNSGRFGLQIDGCYFKFLRPDVGYEQNVDTHFHAAGLVVATGTYFGQYSNVVRRLSFYNAAKMSFIGCTFDGEPQFKNENIIRMDKCSNAYAGQGLRSYSEKYGDSLTTLGSSGYEIQGSPFAVVENSGPLNYIRYKAQNGWDVIGLDGSVSFTVSGSGTATFTTANAARYKVGDFITTITAWNGEKPESTLPNISYSQQIIGRVNSIIGTTVTLNEVPISFTSGNYTPYLYRLPIIRNRTVGTTTSGSADITSVSPVTGWAIGQRIQGTGIPTGSQITNVVGTTITINQNATASGTVEIFDTKFWVELATRNAAPTTGSWVRGDFVRWYAGSAKDANNMMLAGWICTVTGAPGTWEPVYWSAVSPAT